MRRRTPLLPPTLLGLGLLGLWAGTGAGAVPPLPTVSLPTVTLPTVTVTVPTTPLPPPPAPVPPTPTVTVSVPRVTPQPLPAVPIPPVQTPIPIPGASEPSSPPPIRRGRPPSGAGGASSRMYTLRRRQPSRYAMAARPVAATRRSQSRAVAVKGVAHRRPIAEPGAGRDVLGTLASAARAIPSALFAMALMAILLLGLAAIPQPVGTSRAGALLVHRRGSIAAAGLAALALAIATYLLL
jgi:hypothetical protein